MPLLTFRFCVKSFDMGISYCCLKMISFQELTLLKYLSKISLPGTLRKLFSVNNEISRVNG